MYKVYIFNFIYSVHKEGWQLDRVAITIYTNPFSVQQEQVGIISLSKRITATNLERWAVCLDAKDLIGGIRDTGY